MVLRSVLSGRPQNLIILPQNINDNFTQVCVIQQDLHKVTIPSQKDLLCMKMEIVGKNLYLSEKTSGLGVHKIQKDGTDAGIYFLQNYYTYGFTGTS